MIPPITSSSIYEAPVQVDSVVNEFFPGQDCTVTPLKVKRNSVVKVEASEGVFVVRESYPGWTEERCKHEIEIARFVAKTNAGPQVLGVSKDSRFMLLEYFNGGVLHPGAPIDLKETAECFRMFHSIGLPKSVENQKFSTSLDRFNRQFQDIGTPLSPNG